MFQLKHSDSYKEKLEIAWIYDKIVDHQTNCIKEISIWNQWASWFILLPMKDIEQDLDKINKKRKIVEFIGLDECLLDAWYDMRRRKDPLPDDINFFDVVFEFFFDKHYDISCPGINVTNVREVREVGKIRKVGNNIHKNEKTYLLKIGLRAKDIQECIKCKRIAYGHFKYKFLLKAISFVYDKMKKYEEFDKKNIKNK